MNLKISWSRPWRQTVSLVSFGHRSAAQFSRLLTIRTTWKTRDFVVRALFIGRIPRRVNVSTINSLLPSCWRNWSVSTSTFTILITLSKSSCRRRILAPKNNHPKRNLLINVVWETTLTPRSHCSFRFLNSLRRVEKLRAHLWRTEKTIEQLLLRTCQVFNSVITKLREVFSHFQLERVFCLLKDLHQRWIQMKKLMHIWTRLKVCSTRSVEKKSPASKLILWWVSTWAIQASKVAHPIQ